MKLSIVSFFLLTLSLQIFAQDLNQVNELTRLGKHALTHPEKIASTAQKIQGYFSNKENQKHFDTPEVHELAQIQMRLINILMLTEDLTRSSCDIDRTKTSELGLEILENSLNAPMCSDIDPTYFKDHTKITSFIEELKIIEQGAYTGQYAISEEGNIVYPWELGNSAAAKQKYEWRQTLEQVVVSDDGKVEQAPAHDPPREYFVDELYRESISNAFETYLHLEYKYKDRHKSPEKLLKNFCTEKKSFTSKIFSSKKPVKCPEGMQKYLLKMATAASKKKAQHTFEGDAKELNTKLARINKLRKELANNSSYRDGYRNLLKPKWIDEGKAKKDYAEYMKEYQSMISSGPGIFIATDELASDYKASSFDAINFHLEPTSYAPISKKRFQKAFEEAQDLTFTHAQELLTTFHEKIPTEEKLKTFIKLNPHATAKILLNKPQYAHFACDALKLISYNEMNDQQLKLVAYWGGNIVGGALILTGVGSGVGTSMLGMGAISAASSIPSLVLSYNDLQDASKQQAGAIARLDGKAAQEYAVKKDIQKQEVALYSLSVGSGLLTEARLLAGSSASFNATALKNTLDQTKQRLTKYYVNTIKASTIERTGSVIKTDTGITLELGKDLGKGSRGIVTEIKTYEGIDLPAGGEYVAKQAHKIKGIKTTFPGAKEALEREISVYDDILGNLDEIKKSKHYPKDAPWPDGTPPVMQIRASIQTKEGLVLIKDKLTKSMSLDELKLRGGGKLSAVEEVELKKVYDFAQAVYDKHKITINGVPKPFSSDIAKANVKWIEDPAVLKQFGYKKPGFILLEYDISHGNRTRFIDGTMSSDQYLNYMLTN